MSQTAVRNKILSKLSNAPKGTIPERPELMPFPELAMTREELVARFTQNLAEQTGVVYRVKDNAELLEKLAEVLKEESVQELAITDDDIVAGAGLEVLHGEFGMCVTNVADFKEKKEYKEYLFTKADAGITGADFAIAESGTLAIAHDNKKSRLVSLAPALHIAVVAIENLIPVYETAVHDIFKNGKPSQMTFITGPSLTADIQATPFRGMHGPKRLITFLLG